MMDRYLAEILGAIVVALMMLACAVGGLLW